VFLFLWGVAAVVRRPRSISRFDTAACIAGVFYILKGFPVWPWFNRAVASIPILDSSWFTVYFLPILLWFFAHFAARGAQSLFALPEAVRSGRISGNGRHLRAAAVGAATLTVAALAVVAAQGFDEVNFWRVSRVSALLGVFAALCLYLVYNKGAGKGKAALAESAALVLLLLIEGKVTRPDTFMAFDSPVYREAFDATAEASAMVHLLNMHGIPPHEVRERYAAGEHLHWGIPALDNGASAILTQRSQTLRTRLFESDWEGYLRIENAITPDSWRLTSANLFLAPKDSWKNEDSNGSDLKILGEAGSKYVVFDTRALSRAYLASRCIVSGGLDQSRELLAPDRIQLGSVAVEGQSPAEQSWCESFAGALENVGIREDQGSVVTLEEVRGPALLVLNDSYYPGWQAVDRITKQPLEIKPANMNFRALLLTESRPYAVEFRYEPAWLPYVYALMGASIGVTLAAGLTALGGRYRTATA
jgi:hypothetical protein